MRPLPDSRSASTQAATSFTPVPAALLVLGRGLVIALMASWATWLVLQILAYRRASGERRQQLKWLCTGAVVCVVSILIPVPASDDVISPLGVAALPACIASSAA